MNTTIISFYFIILLLLLFTIYNYSVPIGDGNDTIVMHYDEPIEKLLDNFKNKDDDNNKKGNDDNKK